MVAKINVGSSLFGALSYNQKKMDEGVGRVLCSNKMTENEDGIFNIHTCMCDFGNQIPNDVKTEKPVIHISLNPHPDDKLSDEQLAAIAEEYMEKLGYGNQPYVVYKHEDIDRHHIHVVSLRVDEQGRKIDDRFEHRRSKDITRALEQKYGLKPAEKQQRSEAFSVKKVDHKVGDVKKKISNVIKHVASRYHCLTFNEYRALLSLYNVSAEEVKGEGKGKPYNGVVYSATDDKGTKVGNPLKSSLFGKSVGYEALQKKFESSKEAIKEGQLAPQTKRRAIEALHRSTSKSKFQKELRKSGIDVVLRQNDAGRIYGATFIDHNNSCVLNGSRLGKELSANALQDWFNNPHSVQQPHDTQQPSHAQEQQDDYTSLGGLFDMPMETYGTDPEEEAFRRRMQRKKKKKPQKH